jgi:phosphoribosylaminoimidazole (AIR) synthetase
MRRTFNMGIGLIVVVAPQDAATVLSQLTGSLVIGELVNRERGQTPVLQFS